MKKRILILSLFAFLLYGCIGSGNNEQAADIATSENSYATAEEEDLYNLPSVPDDFFGYLQSLPQTPEQLVYHSHDSYTMEGEQFCDIMEEYYAFPKNSGGYLGLYSYILQCEATMEWYDSTFILQNDEISRADHVLPVPEMNLMLDSEKCKGREAQVQEIIAQYNAHPRWYLFYRVLSNGALIVNAMGNGCEQWGEDELELMKDIIYQWDGEQFVLQPEETATIAETIFKKWYPEIEDSYSNYPLSISGSYVPDCEGCFAEKGVYCYPLKESGYLVIAESNFAGPGCAGSYSYDTWTYKNGVLDTIADVLPLPELELLLNPSKTEEYKAEIADFKANYYDEAPIYYIHYFFTPPISLNVELYPYDCEDTYPGMDETRLKSFNGDKTLEYRWDGIKFVKKQ